MTKADPELELRLQQALRWLCDLIDDDAAREGLQETPARIARAWIEMLSSQGFGLSKFINPGYDEMIVQSDLYFVSMCEHHLLPFVGSATIAYIPAPAGYVVGLSKLGRVLDRFAHRLQLQERLTCQVAQYLQDELKPLGVGVVLTAEHMCMSVRGIRKAGHRTITSYLTGVFRSNETVRNEFLRLAHSNGAR